MLVNCTFSNLKWLTVCYINITSINKTNKQQQNKTKVWQRLSGRHMADLCEEQKEGRITKIHKVNEE
jgi:hypothetical protein